MESPFATLALIVVICIGITAALTAVLNRIMKSRKGAAILGALALPSIVALYGIYDLGNMDVDDPAPGMLLTGGLVIVGLVALVTAATAALVSYRLANR